MLGTIKIALDIFIKLIEFYMKNEITDTEEANNSIYKKI